MLTGLQQSDHGTKTSNNVINVRKVKGVIATFHAQGQAFNGSPGKRRNDSIGVILHTAIHIRKSYDSSLEALTTRRQKEALAFGLGSCIDV